MVTGNVWQTVLSIVALVAIIGGLSTISGCVVADSLITVRGTIINPQDADAACLLALHSARTGKVLEETEISQEIDSGFVVAPKRLKYFISVKCTGCKNYVSHKIVTETGTTEVDLGRIVLERE